MNSIDELKKCEVGILKAFIKVCDTLGLKYYLAEGTLLGAVRHEGFIPWDDDIDVVMPRSDYNRFLAEGQKLLPKHYFIQTRKTDAEYYFSFAKLRDCRTTNIEYGIKDLDINHGVWIDVFPLDYYPSSILLQKLEWFKRKCLTLVIRYTTGVYKLVGVRSIHKRLLIQLIRLRYPTLTSALEALDKLNGKHQTGTYVTNHGSRYEEKEVVPSDWYGEGTFLLFEGIRAKVPENFHDLLTHIYGDYMQLPPIEQRKPLHMAKVLDLNRSYTYYTEKN